MIVKSFAVGVADGIQESLNRLDQRVNGELGQVEIHTVVDMIYSGEIIKDSGSTGSEIVRVVTYTPK